MLVTVLCSAFLFFICTSAGLGFVLLCEKIARIKISLDLFEILLAGLISCFVYFNICSLFFAADYKLLCLPFLASIFITIKYKLYQRFYNALLFIKQLELVYFIIAVSFLLIFFMYWMMPPINGDSGDYHYITIKWYEEYKVIPGLANIHGRFSFNPASFILSAPFCFTNIFHQSIYPLNGVLFITFFLWILKYIITSKNNFHKLVLSVLIFFIIRMVLREISSPTPDVLMAICASYIIIKICILAENKNFNLSSCFFLFIIFCFAVTVKLTLAPLVLFIPFLLKKISKEKILFKPLIIVVIIWILIAVPWLIRNYIFSGYLFFPLPYSDFGILHADWKVPKEVIKLDYMYCAYQPYGIDNFLLIKQMNWFERLIRLNHFYLTDNHVPRFYELTLALLSPFYWIIIKLKKIKFSTDQFIIWLVTYSASVIWFVNSPDFRFGATYFLFSYTIPLFIILKSFFKNQKSNRLIYIASNFFLFLGCLFFIAKSFYYTKPFPFTLKAYWLFPLKSVYYNAKQQTDFKYILLNDGKTKLYIEDSNHNCLNAQGPCMIWFYGDIEMRGNKIEDGFRNIKNEVERDFPFVK